MKDQNVIKCPNCDTCYLPGEIFLPKHFLGQPKEIERDITGNIVWNEGIEQDLNETFICEKCGKRLKVRANISYNVEVDKIKDLDEEYTSIKYQDRISLSEE